MKAADDATALSTVVIDTALLALLAIAVGLAVARVQVRYLDDQLRIERHAREAADARAREAQSQMDGALETIHRLQHANGEPQVEGDNA